MYVSMKNILAQANAGNYAIMAINCFNLETVRSVITAAEAENAPIIIDIFQDHLLYHCDSALIAPLVKELAYRSKVSVALNFDHGQEVLDLKKAIDDGFSSVMVDASRLCLEENIAQTKEIVRYAHARGVSVEGEIGGIGKVAGAHYTKEDMYTNPEQAAQFSKETGVDALAISYGSSHGTYPNGMLPTFDFDRLRRIKSLTQMPLVLHGGSGSGEENIRRSVEEGINKINVGCDFMNANRDSIKEALQKNPEINFFDLIKKSEHASVALVRKYIRWSGSTGKNDRG